MNGSIKYWKKQAKMNLSGHWGSAIAGVLAVGAVTFIGNILSIQLFPGSTRWPMVAGQVFVFVFSLIAMVFRAGYSYMLLNMARDREVSLGNLLYLFHNGPDRVLVAGFILSLLNTVAQLPFYYVSFIVKSRKHGGRADCMARAVSCDASGRSCSGGNPDEPVYADFLSDCRQSGNGRNRSTENKCPSDERTYPEILVNDAQFYSAGDFITFFDVYRSSLALPLYLYE